MHAGAERITPLTRADLQQDVRLAREREARFNQVYSNPDAYSRSDRNLAVWNLPPIAVPRECIKPGTETSLDCMRYAARLHAVLFFIQAADESVADSGWVNFPLTTFANPDGY
jgi:hypothetical protein